MTSLDGQQHPHVVTVGGPLLLLHTCAVQQVAAAFARRSAHMLAVSTVKLVKMPKIA
jgi:hypothetical protein